MNNFSKILDSIRGLINTHGKDKLSDIESLINLNKLVSIYLPWSDSALKPATVELILNDVLIHQRKNIVECGSGISTLFLASLIKQHSIDDAKVYTIDHDNNWLNIVKNYLAELELKQYVKIIYAPLEKMDTRFGQVKWYNTSILDNELDQIKVDQLIVDGPPAYTKEIKYSRFPAVSYFGKYFSEDYSIFLDDTNRSGEQQIVNEWEKILSLKFDFRHVDRSLALGIRNKKFNI